MSYTRRALFVSTTAALAGCVIVPFGGIIQPDGPPPTAVFRGKAATDWLNTRTSMNGAGWLGQVVNLIGDVRHRDQSALVQISGSGLSVQWRPDELTSFPDLHFPFVVSAGVNQNAATPIVNEGRDWWTMDGAARGFGVFRLTVSDNERSLGLTLWPPGRSQTQFERLVLNRLDCGLFQPRWCHE